MKVLIDGKWQEFEVEFGEAHPDGGVFVISDPMQYFLTCWLGIYIEDIVVIHDGDNQDCVLATYENSEGEMDTRGCLAQLTPMESITYTTIVV